MTACNAALFVLCGVGASNHADAPSMCALSVEGERASAARTAMSRGGTGTVFGAERLASVPVGLGRAEATAS